MHVLRADVLAGHRGSINTYLTKLTIFESGRFSAIIKGDQSTAKLFLVGKSSTSGEATHENKGSHYKSQYKNRGKGGGRGEEKGQTITINGTASTHTTLY